MSRSHLNNFFKTIDKVSRETQERRKHRYGSIDVPKSSDFLILSLVARVLHVVSIAFPIISGISLIVMIFLICTGVIFIYPWFLTIPIAFGVLSVIPYFASNWLWKDVLGNSWYDW